MNTPASWIELQIETTEEAAELVAAELAPQTDGLEVRDARTLSATMSGRAAVVIMCQPPDLPDLLASADGVLTTARAAGMAVDPVEIRKRHAHEDEWRDVWKQFFRTQPIGRRFVVRPSWDAAAVADGPFVVDLDPGRAFGTGAHPSTRLVVAVLERLHEKGERPSTFLDLGCGSGILTIVAMRLWPELTATALDSDPEATACTQENLARNAVANVTVVTGTLAHTSAPFDLIAANIQADVLAPLAPALARQLTPPGQLILSGILLEQAQYVEEAFVAQHLACVHRQDEGEWTGLVMQHQRATHSKHH